MDLTTYLDFTAAFDFTGYPKLVLTDTTAYPAGVSGQTRWYEIKQGDGITLPTGSSLNPNLPSHTENLRLGVDGEYLPGQWEIKLIIVHEGIVSTLTRTVEMTYKKVSKLNLVDEFDVFTPELHYRDMTDYNKSGYTVTQNTIAWTAALGIGGVVNGSTSIFDLKYNGSYYSTTYTISFSRELLYQHATYAWLTVRELYTASILTSASQPPNVGQMLTMLEALQQASAKGDCTDRCTNDKGATYAQAYALFAHIQAAIAVDQTTGLVSLFKQFMCLLGEGVNVTNAVLSPFTTVDVGSGGTGGYFDLDYDVTEEITEQVFAQLANKTIASIDLDGIGRKFTFGTDGDIPASGAFIVVIATGKLIYGGTLYPLQWLRIKYK